MEQKKRKKKTAIWFIGIIAIVAIVAGAYIYKTVFKPFATDEIIYVYIDEKKDFEDLVRQLNEKAGLPSEKIFRMLSDRMNYTTNMKTGRYAIKKGGNMPELIQMLRSGNQAPVNLTFNNMRTKENLAGRISQQLMMDSTALLSALNDTAIIQALGFNNNTVVSMFIPNTYEIYWDTSVDSFLKRMEKEYKTFWNADRKAKAKKIGLSPEEVSTLASIVEEEATYSDEYPIVAGLYLNRLQKGMRLEADPTVKFAVGDFGLRRILFKHLETESPYNTYRNTGLPPGPIRVPSIKAIDGTLSPAQHNYIFMCAKEDLSGRHNFATTLTEHNRNAARYQRALNERGIY